MNRLDLRPGVLEPIPQLAQKRGPKLAYRIEEKFKEAKIHGEKPFKRFFNLHRIQAGR